jgi:hypothetical protein
MIHEVALPPFIYFMLSSQPKITTLAMLGMQCFGWSRSLQCNFLPPWRIKMRLFWARQNDYSGCRLTLQTHLVPLAYRICHLSDVEETNFWSPFCRKSSWPSGTRFARVRKRDVSRGGLDLIFFFCILPSPIKALGEVGTAMIHVVPSPWKVFFSLLVGENLTFEFEKAIIQRVAQTCWLILCLLPTENATSAMSIKRIFKDTTGR